MFSDFWIDYLIPFGIGYAVTFIWGQVVIGKVVGLLHSKIGLPPDERYGASISTIVGLVEAALYVGAFQVGKPEFIAVWLGLKTVVRWRHWETDIPISKDGQRRWILGRMAYNVFLVGNALVVVFAALGFVLIDLSVKRLWTEVAAILLALLVASLALVIAAKRCKEYPPLDEDDPRLSKPSPPSPSS